MHYSLHAAALAAAAAITLAVTSHAQTRPDAAGPSQAAPASEESDPVIARVFGEPLRSSDVVRLASDLLPPEVRTAPPATVLALLPPQTAQELTERAITERAFVIAARRAGLDRDEMVRWRIRRAEEAQLQQALLEREVGRTVTEQALRARYDSEAAGRLAAEEVRARHILVRTESEARRALEEARRPGASFAEVAARHSIDPGTAQSGGDLGYFKKGDMVPEFAEAAFALKPGEIAAAPVRTSFGWHVILLEDRRTAGTPQFEAMREALTRQMMQEAVAATVQRVRQEAAIERLDQPPQARSLMDSASPAPPAVAPAPPMRR